MGKIKVTSDCNGIAGLKVIEPAVFGDARGYFMETYNENEFKRLGLDYKFVQDNQSKSKTTQNRDNIEKQEIRALTKAILGKELNEEERGLVTVAGNGAILPEGFINKLEVYRKGFPSLKKYCHIFFLMKFCNSSNQNLKLNQKKIFLTHI